MTEIASFVGEYRAAWERFEMEVKELIAVGDDRVLLCSSVSGRRTGSGFKLEAISTRPNM